MSDKAQMSNSAEGSVKKGMLVVIGLIVLSLIWYLSADRYTPYTQQARVQGFVVGISPKVSGVVTKVWVKNDEEVEVGQKLFEVDRSQYEIAFKKAKSDLQNVRNQMGAGSAGIESAKGNLRAANANATKARQDANRLERIYKEDSGAISVRRLEVAQASLQQALAKVDVATAELERAKESLGGSDEDNANLKAALSQIEKAKLDLENTIVRASSKGIITDLRADVGVFAKAGSAVMTLIAIHEVWINAEYTENNLGNIDVGDSVDIVLDVLPGEVFKGSIRSIGLGVSAGRTQPAGKLPTIDNNRDWLRQSQRFPVVITFDKGQRDQLIKRLRIGGQAEVITYTGDHTLLNILASIYMRIMSWFSYAY